MYTAEGITSKLRFVICVSKFSSLWEKENVTFNLLIVVEGLKRNNICELDAVVCA